MRVKDDLPRKVL